MNDQLTSEIAANLGIQGMSHKEQEELIAQFGEIALKAATLAVLRKLSPEKRDAFLKLAKSGNAENIKAFLDTEVPNHDDIAKSAVAEEVERFKQSA
jgi:hypothetical protein